MTYLKISLVFLTILGIAALGSVAYSSTIHVPADRPTIQDGIDFANDFDTVLVAPGIYNEAINFLGKTISVISEGGSDYTFLRAPNEDAISTLISINSDEGPETLFRGFTVEIFGATYYEDIIIMRIGPFSLPTIEYNVFRNINLTSNLSVIKVESAALIRYNLFYNNYGSNVIWSTKCAQILNNTINANQGGIYSLSNKTIVKNNIVTNSYSYGILGYFAENDYNNCWGNGSDNTPGPNGISEDPKFVDPNSKDYNLKSYSPCINAGDPDPLFYDLNGTRNDIGAYSYQTFAPPFAKYITYENSDLDHIIFDMTPVILWTYYDDNTVTSQARFQIQVGTDEDWTSAEMWDSGPVISSANNASYDGITLDENIDYFLRIKVNNGTIWGDWTYSWLQFHPHQTIHIPADFPTIQEGVDYSYDGDSILVDPGVYVEQVDFIGKNIVVASSQGPEITTIQAPEIGETYIQTAKSSDTAKAIYNDPTRETLSIAVLMNTGEPKGAEISGFTITGGTYTGIYCNGTSPIITNNIITGNSSIYENVSGAIELESTRGAFIKGNIIYNNNAGLYGAAIHMEYCEDDTICYNLAYNNFGYGEIRCLNTNNAIIYNNTLLPITYSGIFKQGSGNVYAYNNIIAWSPVFGVRSAGGWVFSSHNCTWQNYYGDYEGSPPGDGDVYADPLFTDPVNRNYFLMPISPCIDAGDPDLFFNDPDGSRNDIGAFTTGCDPAIDTDGDGVPDGCDNCPNLSNANQSDGDNDAVGDACDNCLPVSNTLQRDTDNDGYGNSCDNCPDDFNSSQEDTDSDAVGDICDNCFNETNEDQLDTDEDTIGDVCDNCPEDYNLDQLDTDGNNIGDVCDWICGDVDGIEAINILDIVYIINYKYKSGPEPDPMESADVDGISPVNILDIVYLINYKYKSGPAPNCP